jgi:Carboxypeptidase regulatory-like domain
MMRWFTRRLACTCLLFLPILLCASLANAQQTLGSINGTVLDPSGAAIRGAKITVTAAEIGVTRTTTTQGSGFFQIFNLPIGQYVVKAEQSGFEITEVKGIGVREAEATTVSVALKVGQNSESVEVTANPLLNATDATNGYTLDSQQIAITPLATDSFTQLAVLSPGVNAELLSGIDSNAGLGNQNIQANGQRATSNTVQVNGADVSNLFNGMTSSGLTSQRFNFNIGGGSTSATSSAGSATTAGSSGTSTSVYGSVGNALPSPPSAFIDELRVNTSMYDAQQGATSGAQIDVNTKSGTNNWHGGVYGTFANNALNASPYFFNQSYVLGQNGVGFFPQSMQNPYLQRWTTGATLGGAIKKNKLYFFLGYQRLDSSDAATALSQMTVPSGLTDDRSATGLMNALTSWNDGTPVATTGKNAFTGINSIASALMNAKLPDGSFLIPSAQTSAIYNFGIPNVALTGRSLMTGDQATISVDYQINDKDRLGAKYYYQSDPITSPYRFSSTGGFPVTQLNGGQVGTIDNTIIVSSHLNWEQRLGFVRMSAYSGYNQTLANSGGPANFGIGAAMTGNTGTLVSGLPGLLLKEFPYSQNDSPGLKVGPYSSFANTGFYQNRLNPSTNLIWVKGPHTVDAGGGYSYTQLNITNNRQGIAQIATKNFESFLEGAVSSSNVLETTDSQSGRNTADRYYRNNEIDAYVQDKWQIKSNLSLTIGVRYDYHGGLTEKYGDMFNFDPSLYNVTGTTDTGFNVSNAGFIVAGNNKYNPTSGVSDSTLTGRQWGVSPRLGFAWTPAHTGNKIVFRGAWGIYYDRGENFQYLSQPAGSGNGGPFGVTESAPLASYVVGNGNTLANPLGTALNLPSGTPAGNYIPPSSNPSTIAASLQQTLNGYTGTPTGSDAQYGKNCSGVQNQEDYTACPDALNFASYARNNVLPYTMNYSLDMQWQPTGDMVFTLGYVGNRGRHAVIPIPFNAPGIATATNPIWGETSSYGFEVLNQNSMSDGYDYDPIPGEPWNTEDGGNTDFRTPYIGFSPNAALFKTVGNSAYDALQTQFQKRLSHNFQLGAAYTWSHALDEQSDLGLFFTGNDPSNLRNSWASSDFDRKHVFTTNFDFKVPNKARESSLLGYVADGWELTGVGIVQSGEPYSLYEFYGASGSIKFGDFPTLMNPVIGIKNPGNPGSAMTGNKGNVRTQSGAYIPAIDPSQISIDYLQPGTMGIPTQSGSNPADIYQTNFAPPQRNIFRQTMQDRLDLSARKNFHIHDKYNLRYDFNVYNITNTPSFDVPMNQGQIRQNSSCSTSAIMAGNNCTPSEYFVNFGQIVSSNNPTDQQSALSNLDQIPFATGSGRNLQIQTLIPPGVSPTCQSGDSTFIPGKGCPNNAANLGSVTNTIGSSRIITMALHVTF